MKFTRKQLDEYIKAEAKKIAIQEGWMKSEEPAEETFQLNTETISEDFSNVPAEEKTEAENKEETFDITTVKTLTEEFSRMKELVDFRQPLFRRD